MTSFLEKVEGTKDVTSEHNLNLLFPYGSLTTMPMTVSGCTFSVNLSAIPADEKHMNDVGTQALLAIKKLLPENKSVPAKAAKSLSEKTRIPIEILRKICQIEMTAQGGAFVFSDGLAYFKPNVNISLLRMSPEAHHEARRCLFTENAFVFRHCGTDLQILNQLPALTSCRIKGCNIVHDIPTIKKVVFDIGDDDSIDKGQLKVQAFTALLHGLQTVVKVKHLEIIFREFCWAATEGPEDVADALGKIEVTEYFEMSGPDFLWDADLSTFPKALNMKAQPETVRVELGQRENRFKGHFTTKYAAANTAEETRPKEGEIVKDAGYSFHKQRAERERQNI